MLWVARIVTISLLLRTYIMPWGLTRISRHIRVRSVSFRSIRGLYIRRGTLTFRVERLGYTWHSTEESRRLTLKIEGFGLEIFRRVTAPPPRRMHKRSMTLAHLSNMEHRFWDFLSSMYASLDPFFRPFLRGFVVSAIRAIIRWLPRITEAVSVEIAGASVSFPGSPQPQINFANILVHTSLTFKQVEKPTSGQPRENHPHPVKVRKSYSMGAWRNRLSQGFRRSLHRALEKSEANAAMSLHFHDMVGVINSLDAQGTLFFSTSFPVMIRSCSSFIGPCLQHTGHYVY